STSGTRGISSSRSIWKTWPRVSMLSAEGLRHAFGTGGGRVVALDNVSFSLEAGQTLAIFGPNGAGKTTLLKVLAGLIRPDAGRATVAGGRGAIGWIGHQSHLYGHLTVRENLLFWAALYAVPAATRATRADATLRQLGIADRAGRAVRALRAAGRAPPGTDRRGVPSRSGGEGGRWLTCCDRRGPSRVRISCSSSARARPSSPRSYSRRSCSPCSTSDAIRRPWRQSTSPPRSCG